MTLIGFWNTGIHSRGARHHHRHHISDSNRQLFHIRQRGIVSWSYNFHLIVHPITLESLYT
jgi:hypothetical protein